MDIVPDDVVISGVGGYFPKAKNIEEFKNRLFENKSLIEPRWPEGKNVCNQVGCIETNFFDNSYFGIHRQQCFFMDPMHRLALERTFEALLDAGVNPSEVRGKRIGVFLGSTIGENDELFVESVVSGFGVTGHSRAMLANRISYWLNLRGPSVAYDANWVSGIEVLRLAYYAIKTGQCDSVIVGTANLAQHEDFQFMYNDLGFLSQDGSTRAFDANATGYARSDGVVLMYIQRSSEARRHYASVQHIATKFDGTTVGDYTNLETENMVKFLEEFYNNSKVKPEEVDFVEAYGCGLKKIDKAEIDALEKVYCKKRSTPLLVGSVKTVSGHSEPSSAFFSIAKTLIAMETDTIPANLQFDNPNPDIQALHNGKIEIVTTNKNWSPKYAAVNALSTSAYFGHVILKANPKKKVIKTLDLPTLLIASTRNEEGMTNILETLKKKPKDPEYHRLMHDVFSKLIQGHLYRGYLLQGEETKQEIANYTGNKRPIWFIYSGMGSQWNEMLGDLMKVEIFAESINRSRDILAKKGVDLLRILSSPDKTVFDNILNCFVGIAAMQIALTDVLRALGIVPDGIIGHSVGELGCAYADGCMTAEQMILSSYSRGRASVEATLIKGMMAAIGLGYNQIKDKVPPTVEVACHNGPDSCTISGPTEDMEKFVESLKQQGTFAKLVNVANIAYHSRYIKPAGPLLLKYLKEVLPEPKLRSSKWISTSNLESNWDTDLAKHSSADYHTNNLLSSVLFEEGIKHIPKEAVLIEIAPHGLLQAILKRSVKDSTSIPLTQRGSKSTTEFLFQSLGKLYLSGIDLNLSNLYPKIEYPVSRNTPSLSDIVHWNHSENWCRAEEVQSTLTTGVRNIDVFLNSEEFGHCSSHKVLDQVVFPISTYLNTVLQITENAAGAYGVTFENILFKKHIVIPSAGFIPINVMIQYGSGIFEIFSGDSCILSGKLTIVEDSEDIKLEDAQIPLTKESVHLLENDVYSELEHRGYKYDGRFKQIKRLTLSQKGSTAATVWNNSWEDLLESMVQQQLFQVGERNQQAYLPKFIQKISLCNNLLPTAKDVNINFDYSSKTLSTPGIEIHDMKTKIFPKDSQSVQLHSENLIPLQDNALNNIELGIEQALQITLNNFKDPNATKLYISELETKNALQDKIKNVLHDYSFLNVNSSLVKEAKQISIVESFPQLLIVNDTINGDILKALSNSESAFLLAKLEPNQTLDTKVSIVARFRVGPEHYVICRKAKLPQGLVITINERHFSIKNLQNSSISWVAELFKSAKKSQDQQIPILLEIFSVPAEGLNNFLNAIRSLPYLQNVRIFYNCDQIPDRAKEALKKELVMTILKNKLWLTCLPLTSKVGDNKAEKSSQTPLIENKLISYIGLNLKDETLTPALIGKNEIGNIDFCGVSKGGQRVMGLAYLDKESSRLNVDDILTWEIPNDLSLEDAITVPHAYASAYYMLCIKGKLKHGDAVLIHKGCSPIGLAAISIAYSYGCQIFTTVSTNRQRVFLKKSYIFLQERNILDSNSTSFETELMLATAGKGVELVLNCVSGKLLKSSLACMAEYGRFIQYCKYDLEEGNSVGMSVFLKNVDLYHVDLQNIFQQDKEVKKQIRNLVINGFKDYVVRPLRKEILSHQNISSAMKKLESPDVIGKIVIDAVNSININKLNVKDPHRFVCNARSSYLVFGGSAANWIDVAEWLVHRGARKIVVSSDNKPSENYLTRRMTILENYYGADIIMASGKVSSTDSAVQLVSEVANLGPLHALFILPNENLSSRSQENETVELFDNATRAVAQKALLVNLVKSATGICYRRTESGYATCNIQPPSDEEINEIITALDFIIHSSFSNVILKKNKTEDSSEDGGKAVINDLRKLIPNIEDIIHLQKNAPNEPELVQLVTEGPTEIRELIPIFIIPGLTGYKELETLVRNLLYPAFCAVLPSKPWPLEKLAEVIAQKMYEISPKEFFNIISISSGGPLAIEIARILAKKNVNLHLFFVDSAPVRVQQGLQDLGDDSSQFEVNFLRTIFEINDLEILKKLKSSPSFEKKIQVLMQGTDKSEENKTLLVEGLKTAKDFVERVRSFKPNKELFSGKVHLLVPDECSAFDSYGLPLFCKNPPTVTLILGDHLSIIRQRDTHEYINKNHRQI